VSAIELDVEAYGRYARLSAIADVAELRVWQRPLPVENLADYLHDRRIRPIEERLVPLESEVSEDAGVDEGDDLEPRSVERAAGAAAAKEMAQQVFELLRERKEVLGDDYPFSIVGGTLARTKPKKVCAYDVALTLTVRHAYLGDSGVPAEFERYVARCLEAGHWVAFPIADRVRAVSGTGVSRFRKVIASARAELRWPRRGSGMVPLHTHDRGADILARWRPMDARPGCRTTLFQATVGSSETWATKLAEAPRGSWRQYIGDPLEISVVLAIPHHVQQAHLEELVVNGEGGTVLDRLRLVAHGAKLEASERAAALAVLRAGVDW
jgi:hypothetical protein